MTRYGTLDNSHALCARSLLLTAWALCLLCCFTARAADRWALLIGVDKCKALGELKVCAADAQAMKDVLVQIGYPDTHVKLLTDSSLRPDPDTWPSQNTIESRIEQIARTADKGDTILVFFSGHGVMRNNESYLVPVDGNRNKGIALSWVKSQLAASKAAQKILILDACHAGAAKGVDGIAPDLKSTNGITLLLSCDKDEVSWPDELSGHSVFTQFLLAGLAGEAAGADRKVTTAKLHQYVVRCVKEWTFANNKEAQTPLMGGDAADLVLSECPDGDIPVEPPPKPPTPNPQPPRPSELARSLSLDCGNGMSMELALIPAGEFMMGSPANEAGRFDGEGPQHRVRITKPFYMGVYEVTQGQYEAVMGANPAHFKGADNPVETVSWNDAQEFCRKLSAKTGQTRSATAPFLVRLPTEAEWEYACRAGTTTRFCSGEADGDLDAVGWYTSNSDSETHAVGGKKPNAWGLYDMHGNVWEWCQSLWRPYPYREDDGREELNGTEVRMLRGGCCSYIPRLCRSALRSRLDPSCRFIHFGFRVVCAPRP